MTFGVPALEGPISFRKAAGKLKCFDGFADRDEFQVYTDFRRVRLTLRSESTQGHRRGNRWGVQSWKYPSRVHG